MVLPLRFTVRLFKPPETAGKVVLPVLSKVILEVLPPVKVPDVAVMAPRRVKVLAPMEKSPAVKVCVPLTVRSLPRFTSGVVPVKFTVRLLRVWLPGSKASVPILPPAAGFTTNTEDAPPESKPLPLIVPFKVKVRLLMPSTVLLPNSRLPFTVVFPFKKVVKAPVSNFT